MLSSYYCTSQSGRSPHLTAERKDGREVDPRGQSNIYLCPANGQIVRGSDKHVKCLSFRLQCRRCEIYYV